MVLSSDTGEGKGWAYVVETYLGRTPSDLLKSGAVLEKT